MTALRYEPRETMTAHSATDAILDFRPFTVADIDLLRPMLMTAPSRTNDFTIGGIYMWADYFRYRRAIVGKTLFIKGVSEADATVEAYSLPVGEMPLFDSIALLRAHCDAQGSRLRLSAVPEEAVESLLSMGAVIEAELTDWADYLYDSAALVSLSGKKLSKKRNHVNAFTSAFPAYRLVAMTKETVGAVRSFYETLSLSADKGITAEVERMQTLRVLDHWGAYPFEGAALVTPEEGIVAFTVGEVKDDTLYVHIEKMRHDINGAGETINKLYAEEMSRRHLLRYINREEDTGDEGLRRAKLSYHPARLLRKYDLRF